MQRKGYSTLYKLKLFFKPNYFDLYDLHTKFQLNRITLRGVPLKAMRPKKRNKNKLGLI